MAFRAGGKCRRAHQVPLLAHPSVAPRAAALPQQGAWPPSLAARAAPGRSPWRCGSRSSPRQSTARRPPAAQRCDRCCVLVGNAASRAVQPCAGQAGGRGTGAPQLLGAPRPSPPLSSRPAPLTWVHSSRRPSRNSLVGGMKPELPTTGSRIRPAISPLLASKMACGREAAGR